MKSPKGKKAKKNVEQEVSAVPPGVDPLLTLDQVRVTLGFKSKRNILRMIHDGTLEAVNLKAESMKKNQFRVRQSVLQKYIESL